MTAEFQPGEIWIQTATGVAFDLVHPTPAMVKPEDIAHGLAGINRYGGHLRVAHYSVAQHSILCAALVWQRTRSTLATQAALLHDAHEAFTGDIKSPVKRYLNRVAPGSVAELERGIDRAIHAWAGLDLGVEADAIAKLIKTADAQLLLWERLRWMGPAPRPWPGDETLVRLVPADFGVGANSPLLAPMSAPVAEQAMWWALGKFITHYTITTDSAVHVALRKAFAWEVL